MLSFAPLLLLPLQVNMSAVNRVYRKLYHQKAHFLFQYFYFPKLTVKIIRSGVNMTLDEDPNAHLRDSFQKEGSLYWRQQISQRSKHTKSLGRGKVGSKSRVKKHTRERMVEHLRRLAKTSWQRREGARGLINYTQVRHFREGQTITTADNTRGQEGDLKQEDSQTPK